MIALVKILIGITLSLIPGLEPSKEPIDAYGLLYPSRMMAKHSTKVKAYRILDNKCNICPNKRNQIPVFTPENIKPWASDIYKQIFIKKRMPKGRKIKLTSKEYQNLLTWIASTKKQYVWNPI